MNTTNVYDGNGRRAGYVNEMKNTVYAHDSNGKIAGRYDKQNNTTYDASGRRYGTGNLTGALVMNGGKNKH